MMVMSSAPFSLAASDACGFLPYLAALEFIGLCCLAWNGVIRPVLRGRNGVIFAGVLISFALSRLRYGVIRLFPLAAYAVTRGLDLARQMRQARTQWSIAGWIRRVGVPLALLFVLWAFPRWALSGNPPPVPAKPTYNSLPSDAIPLHVTFGDAVILEGWRAAPYAQWWPWAAQGWADLETYPAYAWNFWSIKARRRLNISSRSA